DLDRKCHLQRGHHLAASTGQSIWHLGQIHQSQTRQSDGTGEGKHAALPIEGIRDMKKLYAVVGLITFLASLFVMAPARDVYGWMQGSVPSGVEVYQVSGTLLHGDAQAVRINNRIEVRGVHWNLNPWALLTGSLSLDVSGSLADGKTSAHVNIGLGGTIVLNNVISTASISGFKPVL